MGGCRGQREDRVQGSGIGRLGRDRNGHGEVRPGYLLLWRVQSDWFRADR